MFGIDFNSLNIEDYKRLKEVNKELLEELDKEDVDKAKIQKLTEKQLYRSLMFFGGVQGRPGYCPY